MLFQKLRNKFSGHQPGPDSKAITDALPVDPEKIGDLLDKGYAFHMSGDYSSAENTYRMILEIDSENVDAHYLLGKLNGQLENTDEAESHLLKAISIKPDFFDAYNDLGNVYSQSDNFEQAIPNYQKVLEYEPNHVSAHAGLGYVYHAMARFEEAEASLKKALLFSPEHYGALHNMGLLLQDLGNLDEAITYYSNALKYKPDFPQAQWHRSLAYLLRGEFGTGWPDYEIRLISQTPPPREFPYPRWHGEPIPDCSLLIYAEQGIGDEIMFLSCLPDVLEHVGHCVVDCHKKLAPLLKRSFPAITVHGGAQKSTDRSWLDDMPNIDYAIPIGSLPQFYRKELKDFPLHKGYLQAEPERVQYWRERLNQLGTGLKIGISWTGGTKKTRSALRSIPLEQWLPLLNQQDVQFVNLQYTDCKQELEDIRTQHGITITHWQEAIDNYDETAALVSALDLVISVQTALIHLGGALGCPVWVMVPVCPEWRYLNKGSDMPWYPSVHIFRQNRLWKWADVIQEVAHKLQQSENDNLCPSK